MAMPAAFPSLDEASALPVDALAAHVLWFLADVAPQVVPRATFLMERVREGAVQRPGQPMVVDQGSWTLREPPARAYNEAWEWLAVRGLITQSAVTEQRDCWTVSRLGSRVAKVRDPVEHFRSAALLDADLHPALGDIVRSLFWQGEFELAALKAMRQVEIRVRDLASAGNSDIGVRLMRLAFNSDSGPLTDDRQDKGERQATADLFAGAIGTFKNPTSHRQVTYDDPAEASGVVLLADLLLRMLDRRASLPARTQ